MEHNLGTIPKKQILLLTPEQQETIATLEIQYARRRQEHLERASRYRGQMWVPLLVLAVLCLVPVFMFQRWLPSCIVCLVVILWGLIQFHASGINNRLDALLELWESEKKKNGEKP